MANGPNFDDSMVKGLTGSSATCLDALLVIGSSATPYQLRDLLRDAGLKTDRNKAFSLAVIHLALVDAELYATLKQSTGQYSLSRDNWVRCLGLRATRENRALQQLAATRLSQLDLRPNRGMYYQPPDFVTSCILCILANDGAWYQRSLAELQKTLETSYYYRAPDTKPLDAVLAIPITDFWSWRDLRLQVAFTVHCGNHWNALLGDTVESLLQLYRQEDFLEIEEFRGIEVGGVYLLHRVLNDELVRSKHFDLDLLNQLATGQTPEPGLLAERLHVIDERIDLIDVVILLAALRAGETDRKEIDATFKRIKISFSPLGVQAILYWNDWSADAGAASAVKLNSIFPQARQFTPLDWMLVLWSACWTANPPPNEALLVLIGLVETGRLNHLPWTKGEICHALAKLIPLHDGAAAWRGEAERISQEFGFRYLLELQAVVPAWERTLRRIEGLSSREPASEPESEGDPPYRTAWFIDVPGRTVVPKEQKRGKSGYSRGRKVNWDELYAPGRRKYRSPQDIQTINALRYPDGRAVSPDGYFRADLLTLDFGRILYELAGHPYLFLDEKKLIPCEVKQEHPSLSVADKGDYLELRFDPPYCGPGNYQFRKITPTRYAVYRLDDKQLELSKSLDFGIQLPASERVRLDRSLEGLRNQVTVHSDTDLIDTDLPVLPGSTRLSAHLLPYQDGYRLEILARPVSDQPIYFKPGQGLTRSVVADEEGRKVLERDLAGELRAAQAVIGDCPTLNATDHQGYEWLIGDQLTALRVLLELRRLVAEDRIGIEYPRGQQLRLGGAPDLDALHLSVGAKKDWFEVTGGVDLDEGRVLDLQLLIEQTRQSEGEFISLGEGEFIALTEALRDRIMRMEGLLHDRGGKLQLPSLAVSPFAELAEGLEEIEYGAEWQEALSRIERARNLRPELPDRFEAELRPYQREGYDWLMRLAAWGVGACLADDMGLGKTVQALALLVSRAEEGPALVLAPASVIRNWRAECARFAPGLRPVLLARAADKDLIRELGNGDLLLVSYGLLPYVAEQLQEVEYGTIVLDEAQAIKNAATRRARAVGELNAKFKLATTGTPIENHLGELWSLFRFLNPGLLGGKTAFNEKYGIPISRDNDAGRGDQLRQLVQPFILRRRKDEVLRELPAKTEVILSVSPGTEEAALYEALRRKALEEIEQAPPERKRFVVLSQLTRLRQAACHPELVRPGSKLRSAKLDLFGETVREILDNGHKALVFSQFVKHLKIVEQWVKQEGISYQYLDGSTPGNKRSLSVDAFQAGEGDLFLISLKAGGTGLNLTAADYVLHLDPWWNPAVEDQASDRAHRIGQQRPVTVYRFVTEGTIEEKVVALHADKRDLADRILAGTGKAATLEVDQILQMLRE